MTIEIKFIWNRLNRFELTYLCIFYEQKYFHKFIFTLSGSIGVAGNLCSSTTGYQANSDIRSAFKWARYRSIKRKFFTSSFRWNQFNRIPANRHSFYKRIWKESDYFFKDCRSSVFCQMEISDTPFSIIRTGTYHFQNHFPLSFLLVKYPPVFRRCSHLWLFTTSCVSKMRLPF